MANTTKLYFALSFSFILLAVIVYAVQTANLAISNVTAFSNTTDVPVPVYLSNNESVAGFQLTINHTPYLIFKDVEPTSRMPNSTIETKDESGELRIAALIKDGIAAGGGIIMNITFDVDESAAAGEYPLSPANAIFADINTQTFSTGLIQGIFTILVDSDGDGIDDSTDLCPSTYGCPGYDGCSFGLKEWLPPITIQDEFDLQQGATLPLKFNATDCSGEFYNDSGIKVRVYNETLSIDKTYNASGEGSDFVRINETEGFYIINIDTNELNMSLGDYDIYATFSNNLSYGIGFELVQKGDSQSKGKGKGPK